MREWGVPLGLRTRMFTLEFVQPNLWQLATEHRQRWVLAQLSPANGQLPHFNVCDFNLELTLTGGLLRLFAAQRAGGPQPNLRKDWKP